MASALLAGLVAASLGAGCGSAGSDAGPGAILPIDAGEAGPEDPGGNLGDDAGDAGGSWIDAACASEVNETARAPANIVFVIDRSGSMTCNPPPLQESAACERAPAPLDAAQPTKWSIVRDELKAAVGAMSPLHSVAISYFSTDDECGVSSTPAVPMATIDAAQIERLQQSLDAVRPKGSTPIIGATTLGYDYLHTSGDVTGTRFLVLLTDGAETCAPEQQEGFIADTVSLARSAGIRTFVLGAPGSEPARAFLSRIAHAGGTASSPTCVHDAASPDVGDCHVDMTKAGTSFKDSLNTALATISRAALSCTFDIPPSRSGPIDYEKVNVTFTPGSGQGAEPVYRDERACRDGAEGWHYSTDRTKIILCGDICSRVRNDLDGKISIALGCKTVIR